MEGQATDALTKPPTPQPAPVAPRPAKPTTPSPQPAAPVPAKPTHELAPGGRLVQGIVLKVGIISIGASLLAAAVLLQSRGFLDPALFGSPGAHQWYVQVASMTAALLVNAAMFLLLTFALLVGVLRTDLSDSTRKAFMAFALILFVAWFLSILALSQIAPFVPFGP